MNARRIGIGCVGAAVAVAVAIGATRQSVAAEPSRDPAEPASTVQSPTDQLADAPGRERAAQCGACHSFDYIRMNSRFLDLAGWTAVVNKMVKVYGAPIPQEEVDSIARYLTEHYGKPALPR